MCFPSSEKIFQVVFLELEAHIARAQKLTLNFVLTFLLALFSNKTIPSMLNKIASI